MTWEEAVLHFRKTADPKVVRQCYFHEDILDAVQDFSISEEFKSTISLLGLQPTKPLRVLDLGAGNGIASFAFAQLGCTVVAVEPDPSSIVGANAIRSLNDHLPPQYHIEVIESVGESLPFSNHQFDLVYARQVLHHASNLHLLLAQIFRVLKPGGRLFSVRDHVVNNDVDLQLFLKNHLLHRFYGGENAFSLAFYREAILSSGLMIERMIPPLSSVINFFPSTEGDVSMRIRGLMKNQMNPLSYALSRFFPPAWVIARYGDSASAQLDDPGRLYSFICRKPAS